MGTLEDALEVLLKIQHNLQTLDGAIADDIALGWGAERSSTFSLVSVIPPKVHSVALDLRLI